MSWISLQLRPIILVFIFLFVCGFKGEQDISKHPDFKLFTENEKNTIGVFQKSVNSVVNITIEKTVIVRSHWFYGTQQENMETGAGSGFVWDREGHIVTNTHVVFQGDVFWVSFHKNKKRYKAKLVGKYPQKDLAVLKLIDKPSELNPILKGESKNLMAGQKAIAIGNPLGLDHTMTVGVISALGRKIPGFGQVEIHGVIQTDAAINQGNSGGPLLDSQGKMIGVNTMIYSLSGSNAGLGFAIPIDIVKSIIPELIAHGKIVRPGLGIGITENPYGKGLILTYISSEGGAAKAGLQAIKKDGWGRIFLGDILLSIEGKEIENYNDVFQILEKYKEGDFVSVEYLRRDRIIKTKIKLSRIVN